MGRKVIIGSRGSDLALWQANTVKAQLESLGATVEIQIIKTQGDKIQHLSFDKMEGKGFFTKEIEAALLNKSIDLAVHSHKDLETTPPPGLVVAAVSEREDPSELLLVRSEVADHTKKWSLPQQAVVGTSSARRKAQLLAMRPDIELNDLRGNVPTRINKLREQQYHAIVLAKAGVTRLGLDLSDFIVNVLDPREFVPAPAQGALALQIREGDQDLAELLSNLNHPQVAECIGVERKILNLFDGGCQLPLGVYCIKDGDRFKVWAAAADAWDAVPRRLHRTAASTNGWAQELSEELKTQQSHTVFISRDLDESSLFASVCQAKGLRVVCRSLIDQKRIAIDAAPVADWYFFSSPSGVTHFSEQHSIPPGVQIGAIGAGTAGRLMDLGYVPNYVGEAETTAEVAAQFAGIAGAQQVVFPVGKNSLRTVQQAMPQHQVIELEVYETLAGDATDLPDADVLVFTSPSNVRSYMAVNAVPVNQRVIAMGEATGRELTAQGVTQFELPWAPSELALADLL